MTPRLGTWPQLGPPENWLYLYLGWPYIRWPYKRDALYSYLDQPIKLLCVIEFQNGILNLLHVYKFEVLCAASVYFKHQLLGCIQVSGRTGRSTWILHRKLRYYVCCLRDVIVKIEEDL